MFLKIYKVIAKLVIAYYFPNHFTFNTISINLKHKKRI